MNGIPDPIHVQGLGCDAVWISPVVANTDCGYHGYWASDLGALNPHFGPAEDLSSLSDHLHQRGMALMVDVVFNHMGPTSDFAALRPFNSASFYHYPPCRIEYASQVSVETCWLADLPDLRQEDPEGAICRRAHSACTSPSAMGIPVIKVPEPPPPTCISAGGGWTPSPLP